MPVLVYTENVEGKFKKSTFEIVSYGRAIADQNKTSLVAISIGDVSKEELAGLGKYGADKVLNVSNEKLKNFINQAYASVVAEGVAEPKIPNMRGIMSARTKPLVVIEPVAASTLSNVLDYETPKPRSQVKLVPADNVAKLVGLLHDEARVI